MSLLEFQNVDKFFGDFKVLEDIDFSVDEGEVVVVIGPSGSGKSTLLRCINALEEISSGKLVVDGIEVHAKKTKLNVLRTEIGFVFQQFNDLPDKHPRTSPEPQDGVAYCSGCSPVFSSSPASSFISTAGVPRALPWL